MDNAKVDSYITFPTKNFRIVWHVKFLFGLAILVLFGILLTLFAIFYNVSWNNVHDMSKLNCHLNTYCGTATNSSSMIEHITVKLGSSLEQSLFLSADSGKGTLFEIQSSLIDNTPNQNEKMFNGKTNIAGIVNILDSEREKPQIRLIITPLNDTIEVVINLAELQNGSQAKFSRPTRVRTFTYDEIVYRFDCGSCTDLSPAIEGHINLLSVITEGFILYNQGFSGQATQDFLISLHCSGVDLVDFQSAIGTAYSVLKERPNCSPLQAIEMEIAPLYYYAAKSLALTGYYELATSLFDTAIVLVPNEPANLISLAQTKLSWTGELVDNSAFDDLSQALYLLDNLEEIHPLKFREYINYDRGLISELNGDYNSALTYFEASLKALSKTDGNIHDVLFALARVHHKLGNVESSKTYMIQALSSFPTSPWPNLQLAKLNYEDRDVAQAYIESAKLNHQDEPYTHVVQAELCQIWKDFICAEEAFEQALKLHPDSGWLQEKLGALYLQRAFTDTEVRIDYLDQALILYHRSATTSRPEDPWSHERYAYALLNKSSYLEAARHYEQAITLSNPRFVLPRLFCNLSLSYEHSGNDEYIENQQTASERCQNATTH